MAKNTIKRFLIEYIKPKCTHKTNVYRKQRSYQKSKQIRHVTGANTWFQSEKLTKWREYIFYSNHVNKASTKAHWNLFRTLKWQLPYTNEELTLQCGVPLYSV